MIRIVTLILIGAMFLSREGVLEAQETSSKLDAQAYEMYQQVLSPFCPGRSLNDCPSSKAHDLKDEMRQRLEQGVPPQEIIEEVFARFGDQYRAVPHYTGFGKLVWWVPLSFVAIGALLIVLLARGKQRKDAETKAPRVSPLSDEQRRAIESELESFEG
jgi:cytochrome c-type biogenesis protein CcmH